MTACGYKSGGISNALRYTIGEFEYEVLSNRRSRQVRLRENVITVKVEAESIHSRHDGYQKL